MLEFAFYTRYVREPLKHFGNMVLEMYINKNGPFNIRFNMLVEFIMTKE